MNYGSIVIHKNMKDYPPEYRNFSLSAPEKFSFPLDVFDKWENRPALYWTDGVIDKKLSFAELKLLSSKGAGALKNTGIGTGDKVLVMVPGIPEWWEVMLALMRINAIPIPATTLLTSKDIEYRLAATDIKAIIAAKEDADKVKDALKAHGNIVLLIIINPPIPPLEKGGEGGFYGERPGWHNYTEERDSSDAFEGERAFSSEPALIYFTSGTTGPPKMVLHTQASYPLAHLITGKYWLDLKPGDMHWNLSDPGWAKAAWSSLFGPWHMGATIFSFYRKGKFDPSLTMEILQKYPITTFCGPPTAYRMIVKEIQDSRPGESPEATKFKFKSARHFVAAGEPLNKEIIEIWKEKTGEYIYDGYGQTETVNILANFRCLPVKPGSMGVPVPGFSVDIIDDSGNPVSLNTEGDIAIKIKPERPVGLFREYLGNPEATEKTVRGDWYITGDRAYKDEDSYFWFIGRADDVILTSGYRIGPFEIESILIEHPAVKESAVVASPDEIRGEIVKAFVVLIGGYNPSDALTKELQEFVKSRTAPYKYPRKIEFVDDLPKTISGKIKRKELKMREFGKT
ncbi:MAG: acyl--CoA ligase [Thermodesulfovibrionales bacterium]|nr:acyl--CoA ligase [Thermodesulfovibrionales bacterium]